MRQEKVMFSKTFPSILFRKRVRTFDQYITTVFPDLFDTMEKLLFLNCCLELGRTGIIQRNRYIQIFIGFYKADTRLPSVSSITDTLRWLKI